MPANPYEDARKAAEALDPTEQLRLVAELAARLSGKLDRQPRTLLELEGLGREAWQGLRADDYLRRERSWWDG